MEKNYLSGVALIVLAVVLGLLGLYWLPSLSVGDWTMRKVDLLADVRNDSVMAQLMQHDSIAGKPTTPSDSEALLAQSGAPQNTHVLEGSRLTRDKHGNLVTLEDSIINAKAETTEKRQGVTSIIDMSNGAPGGMAAFYQALSQAHGRPVRIAVLGDSFIEGDILTAKLRELLQQRFGGSGVGYMPITTLTAGFRRSVKQGFGGWTTHKAVDKSGYADTYNNITGHYFNASPGAWVSAKGLATPYPHAASCTSSSFYFINGTGSGYATAVVNGTDTSYFALQSQGGLIGHAVVHGDIKWVRWTVSNPGNMVFLGTSMDCDRGIIVDNLSIRAARGSHLSKIQASMMSAFNQVRHYDLVIIMYGLNVAGKENSEFTAYCNTLTAAINNIKANMPGTSVLMVGCSDREERTASGWRTMKGVLGLIQAQKRVAINCDVAFWDLYNAMGGEGSIVNMVRNGEANSDYTHINHKGGDHIAKYLYDALMLGFENR